MQTPLLVSHDTQRARHRTLGAAQGEARPKDGDLDGLDDTHKLEEQPQKRAHHAQGAHRVRHVVVLEKVPRRLNDAGEGKTGKECCLCTDGERVLGVVVELTLLDLRAARD